MFSLYSLVAFVPVLTGKFSILKNTKERLGNDLLVSTILRYKGMSSGSVTRGLDFFACIMIEI